MRVSSLTKFYLFATRVVVLRGYIYVGHVMVPFVRIDGQTGEREQTRDKNKQ